MSSAQFTLFDSCHHFPKIIKRLGLNGLILHLRMLISEGNSKEINHEIRTWFSIGPREVGLWNKMESSPSKQILTLAKL